MRRVELRRRKDGSTFWSRADGRALDPDNPHKGSVWTVEDVTAERRAEEELQRVMAEQQALLDNVTVGIAFSRERKVVRCNRRFEEMFGFGSGAAIGASWREIYFTDAEFAARVGVYAELDRGGTHAREQWLRRQDGSGFWCRMSGRAVAAGDAAKGYVWLMEDVSERRRADRGARAPGARAGRGAAERRHRHHLRPGPAHRAREPPLRRALWLRRGRAHRPFHALHVRQPTRSTRRAAS